MNRTDQILLISRDGLDSFSRSPTSFSFSPFFLLRLYRRLNLNLCETIKSQSKSPQKFSFAPISAPFSLLCLLSDFNFFFFFQNFVFSLYSLSFFFVFLSDLCKPWNQTKTLNFLLDLTQVKEQKTLDFFVLSTIFKKNRKSNNQVHHLNYLLDFLLKSNQIWKWIIGTFC